MAAPREHPAPAPRRGGRCWLKRGLLVHFYATALVIAPLLLPVPVEAKISLFFTEGVTTEDRDTAKKAIAATVQYFAQNYQLHLNFNVRLVLAKGDPAYTDALKRHCVMSTQEAKEEGESSQGYSCSKEGAENILIENIIIKVDNLSKMELIAAVSHELVHKFEYQVSGSSFLNINWLGEGVATVISACVAESLGEGAVRRDRQITCLEQIRAKRQFPSLTVLHSQEEWLAAGEKYGLSCQYLTAELAVFQLVKLKGYNSLFQYFRYLKDYDNAQAFKMAFGLKLSEYENYFDRLLAQKL